MNQKSPMLDPRLSLAFDLYDSCELAADIGTDHAHLPAALLQRGRCQHMILTDISEKALQNAENETTRFHLTDHVSLRLGFGLDPIHEKCDMISIMGMGGRTIRDILLRGKNHLQGASLLLSAHTDLPLIRSVVQQIGYYLEREEPCYAADRYYLVLRARQGKRPMSDREVRLGGPLWNSDSPHLLPFLKRRRDVLYEQIKGISSASVPNRELLAQLREDLDIYDYRLKNG